MWVAAAAEATATVMAAGSGPMVAVTAPTLVTGPEMAALGVGSVRRCHLPITRRPICSSAAPFGRGTPSGSISGLPKVVRCSHSRMPPSSSTCRSRTLHHSSNHRTGATLKTFTSRDPSCLSLASDADRQWGHRLPWMHISRWRESESATPKGCRRVRTPKMESRLGWKRPSMGAKQTGRSIPGRVCGAFCSPRILRCPSPVCERLPFLPRAGPLFERPCQDARS